MATKITLPLSSEARELASALRERIGVTGPRSQVLCGAFFRIADIAKWEDSPWPYSVYTAVLGISDAHKTGRLSGKIVAALHNLTDWQMCNLIADVATNCKVSGEISGHLIRRFA